MTEKRFAGKTAIVTGGSRGIGECIAKTFADYGADVIVASRTVTGDSDVIGAIRARGVRAFPLAVDLTRVEDIRRAVAEVHELVDRVDILINNAGAYPPMPLTQVTEEHFDYVVGVNLKGLFFLTQAIVNGFMIPQGYGRIVNITSIDGKNPAEGVCIYSAAKAGVISLTKSFALELAGRDINSNAVAAGWIETEQVLSGDRWKSALPKIPSRRLGKLSEIAESVAFLCDDRVSYINGEILDVNGGLIMD